MTVKQRGNLYISSPSSCLSELEGVEPWSVLQFSKGGTNEETGLDCSLKADDRFNLPCLNKCVPAPQRQTLRSGIF